jgi:hypothetical protein
VGVSATRRGAFAMKWHNRIAQGFYEAELVKAALQKSIFLKSCFVWTAIGRQETYDWLLWCLIDTVRVRSTVMIKHQKSVKLLVQRYSSSVS